MIHEIGMWQVLEILYTIYSSIGLLETMIDK